MKLFLFDIDGILGKTGFIKVDYWQEAIKRNFGFIASKKEVYMTGKTDREILCALLELHGVKNPCKDARFQQTLNDLADISEEYWKHNSLPPVENVENFLQQLQEKKQCLGLLTGNSTKRAFVKIKKLGFEKYFPNFIGAFGEYSRVRSDLVSIAMKDAEKKTGVKFTKSEVYLIGDAVRDIWCAQEAGVKIIAVATGNETFEALEKEKPDYLFRDFNNLEEMLKVIEK